jgi:hypothetical protein
MRKLFFIIPLFVATAACAQQGTCGNGCAALYAQAKTAQHHTEDTVKVLKVQLGYIDADSATLYQISRNYNIGLRVVRFKNYKVASIQVAILPAGGDYRISSVISGNIIPPHVMNDMRIDQLKPGDQIFFYTTIKKVGANYSLKMDPVKIMVVAYL